MNAASKNAKILLTPDSSWQWVNWDGQAELRLANGALSFGVTEQNILTFDDIPNHRDITIGKSYLPAAGFDRQGTVGPVNLAVDPPPSPTVLEVEGSPIVLQSTTGRFTVSPTVPATNSQSGTPDLAVPKCGTWQIVDPAQRLLTAN